MLRPGDTLVIGPGTYQMDASLLIPSNVTVRGTAGKTILLKSRGVESALTEDGDYGESYLIRGGSGKVSSRHGRGDSGRHAERRLGRHHFESRGRSRPHAADQPAHRSRLRSGHKSTRAFATPTRSCAR